MLWHLLVFCISNHSYNVTNFVFFTLIAYQCVLSKYCKCTHAHASTHAHTHTQTHTHTHTHARTHAHTHTSFGHERCLCPETLGMWKMEHLHYHLTFRSNRIIPPRLVGSYWWVYVVLYRDRLYHHLEYHTYTSPPLPRHSCTRVRTVTVA